MVQARFDELSAREKSHDHRRRPRRRIRLRPNVNLKDADRRAPAALAMTNHRTLSPSKRPFGIDQVVRCSGG